MELLIAVGMAVFSPDCNEREKGRQILFCIGKASWFAIVGEENYYVNYKLENKIWTTTPW